MSPPAVPERGWYPDPRGGAGTYRWWDGAGWTTELTDDPTDAAPTATAAATAPAVVPVVDPARTAAYARTPRDPDRRVRPDRVVAGVVVAVLVLAISLVVVLRSDGTPRSTLPLAPPTPVASTAQVDYDEGTRKMQVGDVVATGPGSPWVTEVLPDGPGRSLFTTGVVSNAVVHKTADGDWVDTIVLGSLVPSLVKDSGDATAQAVLAAVRRDLYDIETTVDTPKLTHDKVKGRSITGLQTWIRYRVAKVPSRADRVTILVVAPAAGSEEPPVVWLSSRTDDSPAATLEGLQQALDSVGLA